MIRKLYSSMIVAVTVLCCISTALFRLHGFGGGHGRYDLAVAVGAIPWLWLLDRMPAPLWARGDYVPIVLLPWLLNLASLTLGFSLAHLLSKKSR